MIKHSIISFEYIINCNRLILFNGENTIEIFYEYHIGNSSSIKHISLIVIIYYTIYQLY